MQSAVGVEVADVRITVALQIEHAGEARIAAVDIRAENFRHLRERLQHLLGAVDRRDMACQRQLAQPRHFAFTGAKREFVILPGNGAGQQQQRNCGNQRQAGKPNAGRRQNAPDPVPQTAAGQGRPRRRALLLL